MSARTYIYIPYAHHMLNSNVHVYNTVYKFHSVCANLHLYVTNFFLPSGYSCEGVTQEARGEVL